MFSIYISGITSSIKCLIFVCCAIYLLKYATSLVRGFKFHQNVLFKSQFFSLLLSLDKIGSSYADIEIIFNKLASSILRYFFKNVLECHLHLIEIVYSARAIQIVFFHLCKSSANLFYDKFALLFNFWRTVRMCWSNILCNLFSITHAITLCSGVFYCNKLA